MRKKKINNIFLIKLKEFFKYFSQSCNPPYDCPFCMNCYRNAKEIFKDYPND